MSKSRVVLPLVVVVGFVAGISVARNAQVALLLLVALLGIWGLQTTRVGVMLLLVSARVVTDWPPVRAQLVEWVPDLNGLLAVCMIGLAFGRWLIWRAPRPTWPASVWVGVVLLGAAVGLVQFGPQEVLLREGIRSLSLLAALVLPFTFFPSDARIAGRRLVIAMIPIGALAVVEAFVTGHRATSTFSHPNSAALAFAVLTLMSLWYSDGGRRLLVASIFGAALLSTGSMAGVAALGAGLYGYLVAGQRGTARARALAAAVLVALVFALSPIGGGRLEELASTKGFAEVAGGVTTNSLDWRFYNWGKLLEAWTDRPLTGFGLGSTLEFVQPGGNLPHNEYLRILVELGVIGGMIAVLALRQLSEAIKAWSNCPVPSDGQRRILRGVSYLLLVDALAANTLLYTSSMYLALTLAALTSVGLKRSARHRGAAIANAVILRLEANAT